jgi:hypothetical protein
MKGKLTAGLAVLAAAIAFGALAPAAQAGSGYQPPGQPPQPWLEPPGQPPQPGHDQPPQPGHDQPPIPAPGPNARQDCECERFEVTVEPAGKYRYWTTGRREVEYVARAELTCSEGDDPDGCWAWFTIGNPSTGKILTPSGEVFGTVFCEADCGDTIVVTRRFVLRTSGPPPYDVTFTVEKSDCGDQDGESEEYEVSFDRSGWPDEPKPTAPPKQDPPKPVEDCECDEFRIKVAQENAHSHSRRGDRNIHIWSFYIEALLRCLPGLDPDGCEADFTLGPASGASIVPVLGQSSPVGKRIVCKANCGKEKRVIKKFNIRWKTGDSQTVSFKIKKSECGDDGPTVVTVTLRFGPTGWLQGYSVVERPVV